jgi:hypothetical protein
VSLIHAHIRALRAISNSANIMGAGESQKHSDLWLELGWILGRAADALAQEEAGLKPPREGMDAPITFNPKGKR